MRHKTVLKDLLDIPFDWLMLPWAVGMALAQWLTPLAGQRVVKVRGVTQAVSEVSVAAELRERLLLALLVTLVTFVFPAVVRRSARRWHGWQGRGEQFLFDAPFHRDPLFWLGVLLLLSSITNGSQGPSSARLIIFSIPKRATDVGQTLVGQTWTQPVTPSVFSMW